MNLKQALKRIEELERKVEELQARPATENHFHYHYTYPQPILPTYVPVYPQPTGPIWISDTTTAIGGFLADYQITQN